MISFLISLASLKNIFKLRFLKFSRHFMATLGIVICASLSLSATELRVGATTEPVSLDPQLATTVDSAKILGQIFEGLLDKSPEGKLVPGCAESWDISADQLTYTFHLRPGLKWSNGDPIKAHDFEYTLKRAIDPKTASLNAYSFIILENGQAILKGEKPADQLGVKALDDQTLEIKLAHPAVYLLHVLSLPISYPVHQKTLEVHGKDWLKPGNIVCNGPYIITEWFPNQRLVLSKSPTYIHADQVSIDKVTIYPIEDHNTRVKKFIAGELDFAPGVSPGMISSLQKTHPESLHTEDYAGTYYLGFNMRNELLKDNKELRQALVLAVDQEAICEKVLLGQRRPAKSYLPPYFEGYAPYEPAMLKRPYGERIEEARKLLEKAGYTPESLPPIELIYNTDEDHKKIMVAIAAMWKKALGIKVNLRNEEWKVFLNTFRKDNHFHLFRMGVISSFASPFSLLVAHHSLSTMNSFEFKNPEFDRLIEQARGEPQEEKQFSLLQEAEKVFTESYVIAPIFHYKITNLIHPKIKGVKGNVLDVYQFKHMRIDN